MSNLISEINEISKSLNYNLILLSEFEEEELFDKLKIKFGFDYDNLFIWQSITKFKDVEYQVDEWQEIWSMNLDALNENIYICISDESYYPWKIYFGSKQTVLNTICELPFFEYFVFDKEMDKVIFDTHHNFFRIITI